MPILKPYPLMVSVMTAHILVIHAPHLPQAALLVCQDSTSSVPPVLLLALLEPMPRMESVFALLEFFSEIAVSALAPVDSETSVDNARNVMRTVPVARPPRPTASHASMDMLLIKSVDCARGLLLANSVSTSLNHPTPAPEFAHQAPISTKTSV